MICPNCFSVETEDGLRCRKCGAQLHTGIFQRPAVPPATEEEEPAEVKPPRSPRSSVVALGVLAIAVLVLLTILSRLEAGSL